MPERASAPSPIVKLGGSLVGGPSLAGLLAVSAAAGAFVVPGGGPFADAVRRQQSALGFDDVTAHRMAILAMEQTAHLFAGLGSDLPLRADPADVADAVRAGRGGLWAPSRMALAAELPASWDVTSDSLALWLAHAVRATRFVLVKSAPAPTGSGPRLWAEAGLVDAHFPALAENFAGEILCVEAPGLADALAPDARAAA